MIVKHPERAISTDTARPMPRLAPVTMAIFLAGEFIDPFPSTGGGGAAGDPSRPGIGSQQLERDLGYRSVVDFHPAADIAEPLEFHGVLGARDDRGADRQPVDRHLRPADADNPAAFISGEALDLPADEPVVNP